MAFPEAKGKNIADNTELLFLKGDGETTEPDEESLDSVELEAKLAAVRIRELTDPEHGMDIYDGALGDYRKAGYKDIVILLRTVTGWAEKFVDVLASENIPSTAEMSAGFFDTLEILTMLSSWQLSIIRGRTSRWQRFCVRRSPVFLRKRWL